MIGRKFTTLAVAFAVAFVAAGCGMKTTPRAPEAVKPRTISQLSAKAADGGIRVEWPRPRDYAGGDRMRDLGGFQIFRSGAPDFEAYAQIGTVAVHDRERFQQAGTFAYVDKTARSGEVYRYYVVSFTIDGYVSDPSNVAEAALASERGK